MQRARLKEQRTDSSANLTCPSSSSSSSSAVSRSSQRSPAPSAERLLSGQGVLANDGDGDGIDAQQQQGGNGDGDGGVSLEVPGFRQVSLSFSVLLCPSLLCAVCAIVVSGGRLRAAAVRRMHGHRRDRPNPNPNPNPNPGGGSSSAAVPRPGVPTCPSACSGRSRLHRPRVHCLQPAGGVKGSLG